MAVGLAMFLPTAWAKGCRAPCGTQGRVTGTCQPARFGNLPPLGPPPHHLEHGVLGAVALAGHDAGAAHQPRGQIVHDVPVEVGHHQHVKLVGILHQLGWEGDWEWDWWAWKSWGNLSPSTGQGAELRCAGAG